MPQSLFEIFEAQTEPHACAEQIAAALPRLTTDEREMLVHKIEDAIEEAAAAATLFARFRSSVVAMVVAWFPDGEFSIAPSQSGKIGQVMIVSDRFKGMSHMDRQDLVWGKLRDAFGVDSQLIVSVLTMTHEETEE